MRTIANKVEFVKQKMTVSGHFLFIYSVYFWATRSNARKISSGTAKITVFD